MRETERCRVSTLTIIRGESTNIVRSSPRLNVGARPWPARPSLGLFEREAGKGRE